MPRPRKNQKQTREVTPVSSVTPSGLLDTMGAAQWLGVSRATLFEFMHEEDFPVMRLAERVIRFDPNSLYQWALKKQRYIR